MVGSHNDIIIKIKTRLTKRAVVDAHAKFKSTEDEELEILKDLHIRQDWGCGKCNF